MQTWGNIGNRQKSVGLLQLEGATTLLSFLNIYQVAEGIVNHFLLLWCY